MKTLRLVPKNRARMFNPRMQCRYCGSFASHDPGKPCNSTTCLYCGSTVCMSYGLGNGQCPVCYHGLLPGWFGNDRKICTYKGCGGVAVARGRGRKFVCREHATRQGLAIPSVEEIALRFTAVKEEE